MQVVAFSGGKDSTALALRMHEMGEPFALLYTPTGDELPELRHHMDVVAAMVGRPIECPPGPSLAELIEKFNALPNHRQRWCTRLIKIVPCVAYLKAHPGSVLCVGLRADEEERQGLYGEWATYRYPLREWGWRLADVRAYCEAQGVCVPRRTDCACCPYQRLGEWRNLWRDNPAAYARAEAWEAQTGHTFHSPSRDTWPASLALLRAAFEAGRVPRGSDVQTAMPWSEEACRVCRL